MSTSFGRITIKMLKDGNKPLHLTFVDREIFERTLAKLGQMQRNGEIEVTDSFFGFEVFRSVDNAISAVNLWNR